MDTRREWFLRSRPWTALGDLNAQWRAWHAEVWLPHVPRTTGTTIAARRPEDRAALRPRPIVSNLTEEHLPRLQLLGKRYAWFYRGIFTQISASRRNVG